tara:strand:- start:62 stop:271 length:210 start_codon:yes stop_codon:yes gene_type:complete
MVKYKELYNETCSLVNEICQENKALKKEISELKWEKGRLKALLNNSYYHEDNKYRLKDENDARIRVLFG